MITKDERQETQRRTLGFFKKAQIILTPKEEESIEIADFGLSRLAEMGLVIFNYVNTARVCSRELVLFPTQVLPEHKHPPFDDSPGKEETFRCRWGRALLYIPGPAAANPLGKPPADKKAFFTVWHEIVLNPGDQFTMTPNTLHWLQAGPEGAILSEFSTSSRDEFDVFSDPEIKRYPAAK